MKQATMNSVWRVAGFDVLVGFSAGAEIASAQARINLLHVGAILPLSIAQEQGLFTKHGVEVRLVLVPGRDVPRLAEENPLGYIGAPGILLRAAEGTDVKIVGSPTNKPTVLKTIMRAFKVSDPAADEESYQAFLRVAVRKPYPSLDRLRNMQRIMARHDPKVLNVTVQELVDDRLVRKLDESGAIDRLYSPRLLTAAFGVESVEADRACAERPERRELTRCARPSSSSLRCV